MADDRQQNSGGRQQRRPSDSAGPARPRRDAPGSRRSGPYRGPSSQQPPRQPSRPDGAEHSSPPIPNTVEAKQLAPEIRAELFTLDKSTADTVARHLVAAGELLDEDPQAALAHAQAARNRSGRLAASREAVGIAA